MRTWQPHGRESDELRGSFLPPNSNAGGRWPSSAAHLSRCQGSRCQGVKANFHRVALEASRPVVVMRVIAIVIYAATCSIYGRARACARYGVLVVGEEMKG